MICPIVTSYSPNYLNYSWRSSSLTAEFIFFFCEQDRVDFVYEFTAWDLYLIIGSITSIRPLERSSRHGSQRVSVPFSGAGGSRRSPITGSAA